MGKYTGPIAETVISGLNTQLMKSRQNKQSVDMKPDIQLLCLTCPHLYRRDHGLVLCQVLGWVWASGATECEYRPKNKKELLG